MVVFFNLTISLTSIPGREPVAARPLVALRAHLPADRLDRYQIAIMAVSHALVALWGALLSAIGLQRLLGGSTGLAAVLAVLGLSVGIPILAIFAR